MSQSSGTVRTGRWAWDLIAYPILPPSVIGPTVSVDVKHHGRKTKACHRAQERCEQGGGAVLIARRTVQCFRFQQFFVFLFVFCCCFSRLCGFVSYRTIERASCGTRKLLCTGVVPPTMSVSATWSPRQCLSVPRGPLDLVLAVPADGLFGLCGSERWDDRLYS